MAKIQMDNERGTAVQIQKQQLLEQRKVIQSQMQKQKEELMAKFDSIQRTGKIPDELMEKLGDRGQSRENTRKNDTVISQERSIERPSRNKMASSQNKLKPAKSVDKHKVDNRNSTGSMKNDVMKVSDN